MNPKDDTLDSLRVQLTEALGEIAQLRQERDDLHAALNNHLCQHDMADWLMCAGGHGEACAICAENDKGQHRHALLKRAEQAEAQLATLRARLEETIALLEAPCPYDKNTTLAAARAALKAEG